MTDEDRDLLLLAIAHEIAASGSYGPESLRDLLRRIDPAATVAIGPGAPSHVDLPDVQT